MTHHMSVEEGAYPTTPKAHHTEGEGKSATVTMKLRATRNHTMFHQVKYGNNAGFEPVTFLVTEV